MDLDDFKGVWAKEKQELESRIVLNETLIKDITLDKHKGKLSKFISVSILGRNLTLVYMLISIALAFSVINEYGYSIPALVGALPMLLSFSQHKKLRKPDFINMTTIELQKSICKFRRHTSKYAKYDIGIVAIWMLTLTPIYLKSLLQIDVYSSSTNLLILLIISILLISLMIIFSRGIYQKWDAQLLEIEEQMKQVKEFEGK